MKENIGLTEPEFSVDTSKALFVLSPAAEEIQTTGCTSLKHLKCLLKYDLFKNSCKVDVDYKSIIVGLVSSFQP